jgi:hypothetical protein
MTLSVLVLGSNEGTPLSVIGQRIVEYLEGGRSIAGGRHSGALLELPASEGGTVAYYTDSAGLRPGSGSYRGRGGSPSKRQRTLLWRLTHSTLRLWVQKAGA